MNLPSFEEISDKIMRGEQLNPLERFIFENEPANRPDDELFREELTEAIRFVLSANSGASR